MKFMTIINISIKNLRNFTNIIRKINKKIIIKKNIFYRLGCIFYFCNIFTIKFSP